MKEQGYMGDCDVVSLVGASKELVDGHKEISELILKQIDISKSLHSAKQVILLHHSDCGAYNFSYEFSSPEEEKVKQLEDMEEAEEIIHQQFADIEVIKIWAEMQDSDGEKVNFSVIN